MTPPPPETSDEDRAESAEARLRALEGALKAKAEERRKWAAGHDEIARQASSEDYKWEMQMEANRFRAEADMLDALLSAPAVQPCDLQTQWDESCEHRTHCAKCELPECKHGGFGFRDHAFAPAVSAPAAAGSAGQEPR